MLEEFKPYTFPTPFLVFGCAFLTVWFVFPNPITPFLAISFIGLSLWGQIENQKHFETKR